MSEVWDRVLNAIHGGRVLDVATGNGGFARTMAAGLADFDEIVGVDASDSAITAARAATERADIRFLKMDVERLDFPDGSFDTVAMSAALHHLADIPAVMAEVKRVLRPGGCYILAEMHCDGGTEAQITFIRLHHWVAAVDRALGIEHHATLPRDEIVAHAEGLGLSELTCHDLTDASSDPMDGDRMAALEDLIDRTLARAAGTPEGAELACQGKVLRQRLDRVGAQREPVLLLSGVMNAPMQDRC